MLNIWLLGLTVSSFLMLVVWLIAVGIRNAGIVDIAWSGGFSLLAWLYFSFANGWLARKLLILGMASFWSLRLAGHLYRRVMGHHPKEDDRYADYRRLWGESFNIKMFGFFQIQALLLWVLSLPFLLAARNPEVGFHAMEVAGAALWLIGVFGESLADAQLARFVASPENRGKVCSTGLWRYSRHPNYFFEWVIWIAYFVFSLAQPNGILTLYCPLVMLHFLVNVTGVKLAERGSVARKGEVYREYQRTTSAFIPWMPK